MASSNASKSSSSSDNTGEESSEESVQEKRIVSSYQPLVRSEIRLLNIQQGHWDDPIKCTLSHHELDSQVQFIALSYAWGDPENVQEIVVDGEEIDVPSNLKDALQQIRAWLFDESPEMVRNGRIVRDADTHMVWADAVCINQGDLEEKSLQIPRMSKLYPCAIEVIAWLSKIPTEARFSELPEDDAEEQGLSGAMREVFDLANSPERVSEEPLQHLETDTLAKAIPESIELLGRALVTIMHTADIFYRRWVAQELVLAQNQPILAMSEKCTQLSRLYGMYVYLRDRLKSPKIAILLGHYGAHLGSYLDIRTWHRKRNNTTLSNKVDEMKSFAKDLNWILVQLASGFHVTMKHDMIYAVLGMVPLPQHSPPSLLPNYQEDCGAVYRKYVSTIFQYSDHLFILNTSKNQLKDQPTWVPDLTWLCELNPESLPQTTADVAFSDDGLKMEVHATILGAISVCIEAFRPSHGDRLHRLDEISTPYMAKFTNDFLGEGERKLGVDTDASRDLLLSTLLRYLKYPETMLPEWRTQFIELADGKHASFTRGNIDFKVMAIISMLLNHTFFFINDGTLGWVVREDVDAEQGDIVAIVKGLDTACLLRPLDQDGEYQFLGGVVLPSLRDIEPDEDFYRQRGVKQLTLV